MAEVINLNRYRTARPKVRPSQPGKVVQFSRRERAMALAMSCAVVDFANGIELAGVPSVYLCEQVQDGAPVLARCSEGEWLPVLTEADRKFCATLGQQTRVVKLVRFGSERDVVFDDDGQPVDVGSGLAFAIRGAGSLWAYQAGDCWMELCDGSFTVHDAAWFAHSHGVGSAERRRLHFEKRRVGR